MSERPTTHRSSRLAGLRENHVTAAKSAAKTPRSKARNAATNRRSKRADPGSASDEQEYTPMKNPQKQIRLLHLFPGGKDDELEFQLSTYDLALAPRYVTISYTWGEDKDHKTVHINGKPRLIRPNAHYALWQVRLHHPESYVWIDSISIDQNNLTEKSGQVAIMANIYKGAALTCACVGPAADFSDMLAPFVAQLGEVELEYENIIKRFQSDEDSGRSLILPFSNLWKSWEVELDGRTTVLRAAMIAFVNRMYWTRLWIVQELTLSTRVDVLCGTDLLAWPSVRRLVWVPGITNRTPGQTDSFWSIVLTSLDGSIEVDNWADEVAAFGCENVLDKVYGLLSVINWSQTAETIAPDYTQTPMQLACTVARHLELRNLRKTGSIFNLTADDKEIKRLVKRRQGRPSTAAAEESHIRSSRTERLRCAMIRADSNGRLHHPFQRYRCEPRDLPMHRAEQLYMLNTITFGNWRTIWCETDIAALVCSDSQAGDLIALYGYMGDFLVLRPTSPDQFALIGQGFLLRGFLPCDNDTGERPCTCPPGVNRILQLDIGISDEDALVLSCQDTQPLDRAPNLGVRAPDPHPWYRQYVVDYRLYRLRTRVSERPDPTARLIKDLTPDHHKGHDSFQEEDMSTSQNVADLPQRSSAAEIEMILEVLYGIRDPHWNRWSVPQSGTVETKSSSVSWTMLRAFLLKISLLSRQRIRICRREEHLLNNSDLGSPASHPENRSLLP